MRQSLVRTFRTPVVIMESARTGHDHDAARRASANVGDVDLILRGGRVVDPESGLDAVRDVAVAGGRVAEVGDSLPPRAAEVEVDVGGLVVTSGFIDLHSHVNT